MQQNNIVIFINRYVWFPNHPVSCLFTYCRPLCRAVIIGGWASVDLAMIYGQQTIRVVPQDKAND